MLKLELEDGNTIYYDRHNKFFLISGHIDACHSKDCCGCTEDIDIPISLGELVRAFEIEPSDIRKLKK